MEFTEELKKLFTRTAKALSGSARRIFARAVPGTMPVQYRVPCPCSTGYYACGRGRARTGPCLNQPLSEPQIYAD